jgi:hypothetical protein
LKSATKTYRQSVIAQCKKTATVKKMNDRNKKPTAHSGTFACPYTQATASQAKEPEFFQRPTTE